MDIGRLLKMLPLPVAVVWSARFAIGIIMAVFMVILAVIFGVSILGSNSSNFSTLNLSSLLGLGIAFVGAFCIFSLLFYVLEEFAFGWWTGRHFYRAHSATQSEALAAGAGVYLIILAIGLAISLFLSIILSFFKVVANQPSSMPALWGISYELISFVMAFFSSVFGLSIFLAGVLFGHRRASQTPSSGMVIVGGGQAPKASSSTKPTRSSGDWVSGRESQNLATRSKKGSKNRKKEPPSGW